ncbi:MAG: V-type ATP synthase subunit D [Spirochaetia bacterium]|nr:V-type ATP synthase subunit D [Spirochaetia bacterium]
MASVKLTKNEQKKQKDQLKQFQRYLPTLQLKKQQLQMVIRQIESEVAELQVGQKKIVSALQSWVAVYNENKFFDKKHSLEHLVIIDKVIKEKGNIAGVSIPIFKQLTFQPLSYNVDHYPLWIDKGIDSLKEIEKNYPNVIERVDKYVEYYNKLSLPEQLIVFKMFEEMEKDTQNEILEYHNKEIKK